MSEELAVIDNKYEALAVHREPTVVLEEARKAAQALTTVIEGKKKKVVFNGETYLENEDWLTVARFYGVTSRIRSTSYIEYGDVRGFEAVAEAFLPGLDGGQVISMAEAMCLNDEPNWAKKPLFQLRSMAQTRASSRVLRQVFGWVVVLAGYKPTPAEEMDGRDDAPRRQTKGTNKPASSDVICNECRATNGHLPSCKYRQQAAAPAAKQEPEAAIPGVERMLVLVLTVEEKLKKADKTGKREPFLVIQAVNNADNQMFPLVCWHKSPQEFLKGVSDKPMLCEIASAKKTDGTIYKTLEKIVELAGVKFEDNKPVQQTTLAQDEPW